MKEPDKTPTQERPQDHQEEIAGRANKDGTAAENSTPLRVLGAISAPEAGHYRMQMPHKQAIVPTARPNTSTCNDRLKTPHKQAILPTARPNTSIRKARLVALEMRSLAAGGRAMGRETGVPNPENTEANSSAAIVHLCVRRTCARNSQRTQFTD